MGRTDLRSDLVEEQGRFDLKINIDHPAYQIAKRIDNNALEFYMLETAIMSLCEKKASSVGEYIQMVDELLGKVGEVFGHNIRETDKLKR